MNPGLHYRWRAAADDDSELQADVMRFVAIVALCIVAISSIVEDADRAHRETQTAELAAPPRTQSLVEPPPPSEVPVEPVVAVPEPAKRIDPPMVPAPPVPPPVSATVRTGGVAPITPPVESAPKTAAPVDPADEPVPTDTVVPEKGFTLRFESDAALLRLVARGDAALYLFDRDAVLRLAFAQEGPRFQAAPQPGQFHAITPDTVPNVLKDVAAESGHEVDSLVWGVTLPESTTAALAEILRQHDGGLLIIRANGRVYLENKDV